MGAGYRVYGEEGVLYERYEGVHNNRTTERLYHEYLSDPTVTRGLICLQDWSKISSAQLDAVARRKQIDRLRALLKKPTEDWLVINYCPTKLSRSLTEMQRILWQGRDGVQFEMAGSPVELASLLGLPLSAIGKVLHCNLSSPVRRAAGRAF